MKKIRTLMNGRAVSVHRNDGIRKRCGCARRTWATCGHSWHFSFKPRGGPHYRFPLDTYAPAPIRSRDEAATERDRLQILIRHGQFPPAPLPPAAVPTTPSDLTFETFGEKWIANARAQQSDNQRLNEKGIVRRFCKLELAPGAPLGRRPIGLFTVDDWETAFAKLGTLAASSRNKYRQAILAMQEWACDKGYLPKPWLAGKVIKKGGAVARRKGARRDRRLVPDGLDGTGTITQPGEERRLMAKAKPWLQRLIIAAFETCCRRGELLSLQWRDISLPRGELTIRAENAKDDETRILPISPNLRAVLMMVQHDPAGHEHKGTAFVFGNAIGGQIKDPKKAWLKCCRAADVADLHFHDLRHEAASRLIEQGWPLQNVQRMLGHADAKTTSIYVNSTLQGLQDSMRRFGTGGQSLPTVAHAAETERPPVAQQMAIADANVTVN